MASAKKQGSKNSGVAASSTEQVGAVNKDAQVEPVTLDMEEENSIRQATQPVPDTIRRAQRPAASSSTLNEDQPAPQSTPMSAPASLLNGRFVRDDVGIYRRVGETREAFADEGDKIRFIDKQMDAFQAAVELAKAKGWEAIEVTGSDQFRAEAWFHAKAAGLDVVGYAPNAQDQKRLASVDLPQAVAQPTSQQDPPSEHQLQAQPQALLASRQQAQQFALNKDYGVQTVNTASGRYSGRILHETEHHVVQEIGKKTVALHEKRAFTAGQEFDPASRKSLAISYADGKAALKLPEKTRSLSR